MSKLPSEHKARWFAGAALNTSDQAMASVLSTVLSRLNSFLDSELEQVLCFESSITAESFARKKSAIFDLAVCKATVRRNFCERDMPLILQHGSFCRRAGPMAQHGQRRLIV